VIDHVDGTILVNDKPRVMVDVPSIHVENEPWQPNFPPWHPWRLPSDWSGIGDCADSSDAVYAFHPRLPAAWHPLLEEGQYVRMVGELITDVPHDQNPWRTSGDGGPARWTELHPVDFIERLPDKPRTELIYGAALCDNAWTLDVDLPFPREWTDTGHVEVKELVLPGTELSSIVEGNATRTGAAIVVHDELVHVHIRVQGAPGKYSAIYRLRYRPAQPLPRIRITPQIASVSPGQSITFGVDPPIAVDWQVLEPVGSLDASGRFVVSAADSGPGHLVTIAALVRGRVPYAGGFATATVWVGSP
jgi:hypothetical protein